MPPLSPLGRKLIENFIRDNHLSKDLLEPLPVPAIPSDSLSEDLLEPLPVPAIPSDPLSEEMLDPVLPSTATHINTTDQNVRSGDVSNKEEEMLDPVLPRALLNADAAVS